MDNSCIKNIEDLYERVEKRIKLYNPNCNYWLNLGYWENTNKINKACEQLVIKLVDFCNLSNGQLILDVGFGYGEQDILLSKLFPNNEIHGININVNQVNIAKDKIKFNGLENKVFLNYGDAVKCNYTNNFFDSIISIESAFHFQTRLDFFVESYRLLKKNGVLCLADCLTSNNSKNEPSYIVNTQKMGIPLENQYDIFEYKVYLEKAGFSKIEYIDISEYVIPYAAIERTQLNGWRTQDILKEIDNTVNIDELINEFKRATTINNYYLIKAFKI